MIGLEYIVREFHTSYKEVAQKLDISSPAIQDWLKKRKKIPQKRIEQLSKIFNLPEAYFQKELTFIEKGEIRISYLKSISEEGERFDIEDGGELITYYSAASHEDEIVFLEKLLESKKKKQKVKKEIDLIFQQEVSFETDDDYLKSVLDTNYSDIEALQDMIDLLKNEKFKSHFKTIVYMMSKNSGFGGKPKIAIPKDFRKWAEEISQLLEDK